MSSQILLYNQALLTWFNNNFPVLQPGRTTKILIETPRKSFAEVTTGLVPDNLVRTIPRIMIQQLDLQNDKTRFNPNRIRHLGYCNPPLTQKKISGRFPAPVIINYQIDMHTRFVEEMSRWEEFLLETFASNRIYLNIRPNDTWGDKTYPVFLDGSVTDNSDLEPMDEGDRKIRKTFNLRAECWIFDKVFEASYVVKRFEFIFADSETGAVYDRSFLPPLEILTTGNGIDTSFGPFTLDRPPVLENSLVLQTVIGGTTEIVSDNGSGVLVGNNVTTGTVDYVTGELSIDFSSAPDDGETISVTYFTDLS